jgi:ferric-dicitrate binding protein FerR (iron transport regulator)
MDGNLDHELSHALIGKYLSGDCSPEEAAAAQAWIQASPENGRTFEALQRIWTASAADTQAEDPAELATSFPVDAAWKKVQARIQASPPAQADTHVPVVLPLRPPVYRTLGRQWLGIAAAAVFAIGAYLIWMAQQKPAEPLLQNLASGDQPLRDTLPDGSIVTLNAHSRLVYSSSSFADAATRKVYLQGEAYFDVARNPERPFVVDAMGTLVQVLGTEFNVRVAVPQVQVSVTAGKVRFASGENANAKAVELVAGNSATYHAQRGTLVRDSLPDANATFWLTGNLVFQDRPLSQVVDELSARWQQPIRLANPAIGDCRLTATFQHPSIDSTLSMIAATFNLKVEHDETSFTLSGAGCQ